MYVVQVFLKDRPPEAVIWENNIIAKTFYDLVFMALEDHLPTTIRVSDDSGVDFSFMTKDIQYVKFTDVKHNAEFNIEMKLIEARANARLQTALQSDSIININKRFAPQS